MLLKSMTTTAFAVACLTAAAAAPAAHAQSYATPNQEITNGPQSSGVEGSVRRLVGAAERQGKRTLSVASRTQPAFS